MCEYCGGTFGHDARCPLAPEPKGTGLYCYRCDEEIEHGGKYYKFFGEVFCKDCVEKAEETAD